MHANRVCRYVLIIACRLGPFSLIKLSSAERHQALDAFQHFTAIDGLHFKPLLKGSKDTCSVSCRCLASC